MAFCEVSMDSDWSCADPYAYRETSASRVGKVRTYCFRCGQPACKVDSAVVRNSMPLAGLHPARIRICNDCLHDEPQNLQDQVHNARAIAAGDPAMMVAV